MTSVVAFMARNIAQAVEAMPKPAPSPLEAQSIAIEAYVRCNPGSTPDVICIATGIEHSTVIRILKDMSDGRTLNRHRKQTNQPYRYWTADAVLGRAA